MLTLNRYHNLGGLAKRYQSMVLSIIEFINTGDSQLPAYPIKSLQDLLNRASQYVDGFLFREGVPKPDLIRPHPDQLDGDYLFLLKEVFDDTRHVSFDKVLLRMPSKIKGLALLLTSLSETKIWTPKLGRDYQEVVSFCRGINEAANKYYDFFAHCGDEDDE